MAGIIHSVQEVRTASRDIKIDSDLDVDIHWGVDSLVHVRADGEAAQGSDL